MNAPSSTWFTAEPHWGWLITLYFFLGGLAGGSYFLAALIDMLGRPEDRRLASFGYYIAFPCVAVSGMLLTLDLGRPLRFWHMLIENNTYRPMFKYWSPMSSGSWALVIFGFFTFVAFLSALAEGGWLKWPTLRGLRPPSVLGAVVAGLGSIFGLYIAGYTGVLLAVTNRPIWSDTPLLGMLFIVAAASTSAALMILMAERYGCYTPCLKVLRWFDDWVMAFELVFLVAVVVSLGSVAIAWLNAWGLLLLVSIVVGLIVPLVLSWQQSPMNLRTAPMLVLIGGFLLRVVIIFSAESV
jgi:formate-dependent nitrite reductase membrane component NrfD